MTLRQWGWPTLLAMALALACASIAAFGNLPLGGAEVWPLPIAALAVLAYAIWKTRRWLLLLLVPAMLWPIFPIGMLLLACSMGDCL